MRKNLRKFQKWGKMPRKMNPPRLIVGAPLFFGETMSKYKRPLRGVRDEVFDVDLKYPQREALQQAYTELWETLDEETQIELNMLLL